MKLSFNWKALAAATTAVCALLVGYQVLTTQNAALWSAAIVAIAALIHPEDSQKP